MATNAPSKSNACWLNEPHKAHDWLPFPGSGLVHKGVVRCPGVESRPVPGDG